MYYPWLYTYTCTAVLPVLCLDRDMYGCAAYAVLRSVLFLYVQLCLVLGCVKMYGRAACAVPIPVCTAVLCWACAKMRIFYGLQKCSLA
jgi:hypothetical protein